MFEYNDHMIKIKFNKKYDFFILNYQAPCEIDC